MIHQVEVSKYFSSSVLLDDQKYGTQVLLVSRLCIVNPLAYHKQANVSIKNGTARAMCSNVSAHRHSHKVGSLVISFRNLLNAASPAATLCWANEPSMHPSLLAACGARKARDSFPLTA